MNIFKKMLAYFLFLIMPVALNARISEPVKIVSSDSTVTIENEYVSVGFNLSSGRYKAVNKKDNSIGLSECYFQVGQSASDNPEFTRSWKQEDVADEIGIGKKLIIKAVSDNYCSVMLDFTVYSDKSFITFKTGYENLSKLSYQCKNLTPFIGKAFKGLNISENFCTLDGNGGGEKTEVNHNKLRNCRNNLLATFGKGDQRKSIVFGGLSYHEFEKFVTLQQEDKELQVTLHGYDPIGKRIDPGQSYFPDDRFYIDFVTANPFDALEKYGLAVQKAQKITLSQYDFPTVCLWYAGAGIYGNGPQNNNSKGAVEEAKAIVNSGFLKYSRAAVRLVPDNYDSNNQQGWWDDDHFQQIANTSSNEKTCYVSPFETTEKWGKEVQKLGLIPLMYSQTARRSEDYCTAHPDQMLFNQSHVRSTSRTLANEAWWCGTTEPLFWSYDFTDPEFVKHMKEVYANFRTGGIKGLMFDYPSTAWDYEGGFENKYATTSSAYRDVFRLATEGLGPISYTDERNLERGSDITLGTVASQRAWGDTDLENPLMVSRGGLRWYKNRVVVNYDLDAKNPNHCVPNNRDGQRSMLTMSYVTTGRLVLGVSFSQLSNDQFYDVTRVFPFHTQAKSARPIDAFTGKKFPEIYDFEIDKKWHQLTLYNAALSNYDCEYPWYGGSDCELKGLPIASSIKVELGNTQAEGGLGLNKDKSYYLYDFWNDAYLGKYLGKDSLKQDLRAGEARMISVHEVENHPQFLSTNRHIMQGFLDVVQVNWDTKTKTYSGKSKVVGGETYSIVIASNGYKLKNCKVSKGNCKIMEIGNGLIKLEIDSPVNDTVDWKIMASK